MQNYCRNRIANDRPNLRGSLRNIALFFVLPAALCTGAVSAQPKAPVRPAEPVRVVPSPRPLASEKDLAATQSELIRLLRLSPTLTTVVARDPSLLANQDYVSRNNPQLAQFLTDHPEIGLNPDFYLFTHLRTDGGPPDEALERAVWPEISRQPSEHYIADRLMGDVTPFLVFVCISSALLWLVRLFLENRRWHRIFKLQSDVHGKLIERFGTSQELATYMESEAGKRFLEAAPIPVNFEQDQRVPSAVARVLTPLQIGVVLALLGIGFLSLRKAHVDLDIPMLVIGTMILMPGIGFILSAGISWLLAGRLGMMPPNRNLSQYGNGRDFRNDLRDGQ
jgi:hypothetical protein